MKKTWFGFVLSIAVLTSCASTRFHNIITRIEPGVHYRKIIVHSNVEDAGSRQIIEDAVVKQLQTTGITASSSYQIFDQGSNVTKAQKQATVKADGFDAALFVDITNSKVTQRPVTFTSKVPHQADYNMVPPPNTYIDPHRHYDFVETIDTITTAHFSIQTTLVDTNDYEAVWKANSTSSQPVNDPSEDALGPIMDSYAGSLISVFQNQEIIVKPQPNPK